MTINFLCIGAQKSGTSWLHHNLKYHPSLYLPPLKELHYFDLLPQQDPFISYLFDNKQSKSRKRAIGGLKYLLKGNQRRWCLRYLTGRRTDAWYQSLFRDDMISGEITPAYAKLSLEQVAHISKLMPNGRIIYLLRNPVDRIWSQANMRAHKQRMLTHKEPTAADLVELVKGQIKGFYTHTQYLANLARWEQYYQPDQIFVGFFEQITAEPDQLLLSIHRFLGVEANKDFLSPKLHQPRNQRASIPISLDAQKWLAEQTYPECVALHKRFDNAYTAAWLEQTDQQRHLKL